MSTNKKNRKFNYFFLSSCVMEFDLYADPDVTLVDDLDEKAFTFTAVSRSYKDLEFSDDKDALSPIPSDGYLYRVSEDTNTNRIIAAFEDDEIEMPEDFTLRLGDCFTATQPSTHTVCYSPFLTLSILLKVNNSSFIGIYC